MALDVIESNRRGLDMITLDKIKFDRMVYNASAASGVAKKYHVILCSPHRTRSCLTRPYVASYHSIKPHREITLDEVPLQSYEIRYHGMILIARYFISWDMIRPHKLSNGVVWQRHWVRSNCIRYHLIGLNTILLYVITLYLQYEMDHIRRYLLPFHVSQDGTGCD